MGMLAFVYPGQGSQQAGMGRAIRDSDPELYESVVGEAEQVAGLPLRALCLDGGMADLTRTEVAQPAVLAISLAATELADRAGLGPELVAGHSLGEYTAAVVAGAIARADGMRLVAERGRMMAAVQAARPGTMAVVAGLDLAPLETLCDQVSQTAGVAAVANLNSPLQTVVSGDEDAIELVVEGAQAMGARAAVLPVGAAFHTELMKPVRDQLAELLAEVEVRRGRIPLVSNASGKPVQEPDDVRHALVAQVTQPVRWSDCVSELAAAGVTSVLELGPGNVLARLVAATAPEVEARSACSAADLAGAAAAVA
jgi:[acyl-carrier-protein] S-malonyltransferase